MITKYVVDCQRVAGNRLGRPAYVGIFTDNARLVDMRHVCLSIRRGELLIEFLNGGLGPRGGIWVPDCHAGLAVVHGYAHRLLVFDLPDQLALRITPRASDIRVLGDRYERRKARQACTQHDTLLLAPAVPQRDVHLHISRMPPSQVRPERRQRLQQVWTLLRYETCAYVDYVLVAAISLPTGNFPHRGRSLLQLRVGTHARQVFRCASAPYSELNPITGDQAGIAVTPGESAWPADRGFRGYTSTNHPGRGRVNIVGAQRGFYS